MMSKIAISISPELDSALTVASLAKGMPKSRLIETFLREHPEVAAFIENVRGEPRAAAYAAPRAKPAKGKPAKARKGVRRVS